MPRSLFTIVLAFAFVASGTRVAPSPQTGASSLTGRWVLTLHPPNRGEVAVRMTVHQPGAGVWRAYSRTGAARAFVSGPRYFLGRMLGKVPGRGALAYVENGVLEGDAREPTLRGYLGSPLLGSYYMAGMAQRGRFSGELRRDSLGTAVGRFVAVLDSGNRPLGDYRAVARHIRRELRAGIFDPRLARTRAFTTFFDDLDRGFARARDDLDVLAAFYSRVRRLGTSHVNLVRDPVLARHPIDSLLTRVLAPPDSLVRLSFPASGVAYLYVRKWDQVTPAIDRAFARIDSAKARTLILDIRGNGGGDNSAGAPLVHLLRDSSHVGVFLARKWYASHAGPPSREEQQRLPVLTRDEGLDLIRAIREHGAVAVTVVPRPPYFAGRVFLLIDGASGSASEALAHHLRATARATLIGARTPGTMLTALPHDVGEGWVLVVPEADYYAADGTRLEGKGVAPHVATTSAEALLAAGREIEKQDPGGGALVRALALTNLARWPPADSAYRTALALGSDSIIALTGRGRVLGEMKRWDDAFASLERALVIRPSDAGALYQIGRAAAISGRHLDAGERALREYLRLPGAAGLPSPSSARWRLGLIREAHGDRAGARREYEEALRLDPGNAEVRAALLALDGGRPR